MSEILDPRTITEAFLSIAPESLEGAKGLAFEVSKEVLSKIPILVVKVVPAKDRVVRFLGLIGATLGGMFIGSALMARRKDKEIAGMASDLARSAEQMNTATDKLRNAADAMDQLSTQIAELDLNTLSNETRKGHELTRDAMGMINQLGTKVDGTKQSITTLTETVNKQQHDKTKNRTGQGG